MILNILLAVTLVAYFVIPTAIQWREGETRRESIYLASGQFAVLVGIAAIVAGITIFLAFFAPIWL